jgi:hypothetical protein
LPTEAIEAIAGLSGEEIIQDLLVQIGNKLRQDCNLRVSDNYTGGYSATVTVKANLYGLDTAEVEIPVVVGTPKPESPAATIDDVVEVAYEENLEAVRERSEQPTPNVEPVKNEPASTTKKPSGRRYGKPVAGGGAGDFTA